MGSNEGQPFGVDDTALGLPDVLSCQLEAWVVVGFEDVTKKPRIGVVLCFGCLTGGLKLIRDAEGGARSTGGQSGKQPEHSSGTTQISWRR